MASSTKAWVFDGTPALALRVTSHRKPNVSTPMTADVRTVSTLTVQKPPGPTGCVRNDRWWLMYSVGFSYVATIEVSGSGNGQSGNTGNNQSRANRATRNIKAVTMNAANSAASTRSR